MGEITDRLKRMVRANLNDMLDRVAEFEEQGGFKTVLDEVLEGRRPEIGEPPADEEVDERNWDPPRSEDEKTIRDYYANLEVPFGADEQTVKEAYRRLMKKYHPDRFSESPEMQKLATKLSQELTRAYREVLDHIDGQR